MFSYRLSKADDDGFFSPKDWVTLKDWAKFHNYYVSVRPIIVVA